MATAMRLSDFQQREGIPDREFASRLGVSESHIRKLRTGLRRPSVDLIRRLEEVTGGAVTFDDWRAQPPASPRPKAMSAL